jgi:S1-C subfamily serine protease
VGAQLGLKDGQGLVITSVGDQSLLGALDLKMHDVLLAVDGEAVGRKTDLEELAKKFAKGRTLKVTVLRGGEKQEHEVEV